MDYHNNYDEVIIKCSNDGEEVLVSIRGEVFDNDKLFDLCDTLIINDEVISKNIEIF